MQQVKCALEDTLHGHNLKNYLMLTYKGADFTLQKQTCCFPIPKCLALHVEVFL